MGLSAGRDVLLTARAEQVQLLLQNTKIPNSNTKKPKRTYLVRHLWHRGEGEGSSFGWWERPKG